MGNVKYIKNSQLSRNAQSSKVANNYLSNQTISKVKRWRLTKEKIITQPNKNKFTTKPKHTIVHKNNENQNKGRKKRGHNNLEPNNQKDAKQKVNFSNQSIPNFVRWKRNNLKPIKTEVNQLLSNYEKNQAKRNKTVNTNVKLVNNQNNSQGKKNRQKKKKQINDQFKNHKKAKKVFAKNLHKKFGSSNQTITNFQRWSHVGSKPIVGAAKQPSKNQFKTEKKQDKRKVKKQQNDKQEKKEIDNFSNKENNKQRGNKRAKNIFVNKTIPNIPSWIRAGLKPIKSTVNQFFKNQLIIKKRQNDKKKENKNLFVKDLVKKIHQKVPSSNQTLPNKEVKNLFINKDLVKNIHQKVPSPNQTISNFKRWRRVGLKPLKTAVNQFFQNQFRVNKKQQNNTQQKRKEKGNFFLNKGNDQKQKFKEVKTLPTKEDLVKIPQDKEKEEQFMTKKKQQNNLQQERKKKGNLLFNKENNKQKPEETKNLLIKEDLVKNIHQKAPPPNQASKNQFKEKKVQDKEQKKQFMAKKKQQNNTQQERKKKGNLLFNKENNKQKPKETKLIKEDLVKNIHQKVPPPNQ